MLITKAIVTQHELWAGQIKIWKNTTQKKKADVGTFLNVI